MEDLCNNNLIMEVVALWQAVSKTTIIEEAVVGVEVVVEVEALIQMMVVAEVIEDRFKIITKEEVTTALVAIYQILTKEVLEVLCKTKTREEVDSRETQTIIKEALCKTAIAKVAFNKIIGVVLSNKITAVHHHYHFKIVEVIIVVHSKMTEEIIEETVEIIEVASKIIEVDFSSLNKIKVASNSHNRMQEEPSNKTQFKEVVDLCNNNKIKVEHSNNKIQINAVVFKIKIKKEGVFNKIKV